MSEKKIIGILLAGGMGKRLKELTDTIPKPALHFGGKYRIIDFVLSNCSNSGIDTIGIITQYEPIELTSYIGSGGAWDLDTMDGGVTVLPPYTSKQEGFYWQKGTAHAVYQHLSYIDLYNPDVVLILSTDHIYKMDYNEIISKHLENQADLTIAALNVSSYDANRYGILESDDSNRVISFVEKPEHPKSNEACMGIYVFNYQILKQILIDFNKQGQQSLDFGMDIIPYMINHYRVFRYPFKGYWRDIGTIEALWNANMELIDHREFLDLKDKKWPVYSNATHMPAHHAFKNSLIRQSVLSEGSLILGNVYHSVISNGVLIGENSSVINCVVMPNVSIGKNCFIKNAIIKMNLKVPDYTIIDNKEDVILITENYVKEVK